MDERTFILVACEGGRNAHHPMTLEQVKLIRRALFFHRDYYVGLQVCNIQELRQMDAVDEVLRQALMGPCDHPAAGKRKRRSGAPRVKRTSEAAS